MMRHCVLKAKPFIRPFSTINKVYAKGSGLAGALGISDDYKSSSAFKAIPSLEAVNITKVSCGWGHSAAVSSDGYLLAWGKMFEETTNLIRIDRMGKISNMLARMAAGSTLFADDYTECTLPRLMEDVVDVADVSCSAALTVYLTNAGEVHAFGQNKWAQCGQLPTVLPAFEPVQVPVPPCQQIQTGFQHAMALTKDGRVWAWGKNAKGQLGLGQTLNNFSLPAELAIDGTVTAISCGFNHTAALTSTGEVYIWGAQMSGIINSHPKGIATCENQFIPRKLEIGPALQICSSNFQLVIHTADGALWTIGLDEKVKDIHPVPLRVTVDAPESMPLDTPPLPFVAPPGSSLWKGYSRVFLHAPPAGERHGTGLAAQHGLFDVMLYNAEAFLFPWAGSEALPQEVLTKAEDGGMKIVDYSAGWKHELMVFK